MRVLTTVYIPPRPTMSYELIATIATPGGRRLQSSSLPYGDVTKWVTDLSDVDKIIEIVVKNSGVP